ncbi:YqaA family protein [Paenibacillus alkalitolerans]|uniref:YqaA family protein n=1 Tax=Paenibacillus alkalitolerans TaxID=2799335 RepID=UPI0018F332D0|nr:VTT domain-containing protein [Paenibacillus alkalitolerans]
MLQNILDFLEDFGVWGLAVHSFADAVIFPIPAFFLQVSLSMVDPSSALWLATAGYIACLLGTPFGYLIGKTLGNAVMYKMLKKKWVDSATQLFQKHGEPAILIGAFTPIPFKVFTILSGSLNYPLWKLLAYASLGRAVKFYAVGVLFYMYGQAAESMVKDVSLYIAVGAVSVIAIFLLVRRQIINKKRFIMLAAADGNRPGKDQSD